MILRKLAPAIGIALAFLAVAAALTMAKRSGLVDPDLVTRVVMAMMGLVIAGYGNLVPKQLKRPRATIEAEARTQTALRATGWAMTLAGLVWTAFWIFAPEDVAETGSVLVLASAAVVTFGYGFWACRRGSTPNHASR